jgi:hypothetical protein
LAGSGQVLPHFLEGFRVIALGVRRSHAGQYRLPQPVEGRRRAPFLGTIAQVFTLSPGIGPALVACVLWLLIFLQYRKSFNGVLAVRSVVQE